MIISHNLFLGYNLDAFFFITSLVYFDGRYNVEIKLVFIMLICRALLTHLCFLDVNPKLLSQRNTQMLIELEQLPSQNYQIKNQNQYYYLYQIMLYAFLCCQHLWIRTQNPTISKREPPSFCTSSLVLQGHMLYNVLFKLLLLAIIIK